KMSQKIKFLPAIGWRLLKSKTRDLESHKKSAPAQAGAREAAAHGVDLSALRFTYSLTHSRTYSLTYSLALFTICMKVRCARRKEQQINNLRRWLRSSERPKSEEMSASARCRFRSPFSRRIRQAQSGQQPLAVGLVAHLFIKAERFLLPALQVTNAMLVAG